MHPAPTAPVDDESLGRLLLQLLLQLAHLLLPIVLVAMLPLPWALATLPVLLLAQLLGARLGLRWLAEEAGFLLVAAILGSAFALLNWIPGWWGVPLAALAALFGLAGCAALERRLGLAKIVPEKVQPSGRCGASAWGGGEPQLTPEGEPIRLFGGGEIAMGGPSYCDYLFPDGVLLLGLGSSALFSADARYFVAPIPSRERWGLLVLERETRTLYRFSEIDCFWELDAFDEHLLGRHSPLGDNQAYRLDLRGLLKQSSGVALQAVGDLWLEPDAGWQLPAACDYPAPAGHQLRGEPWLPASLRALDDPLAPLRRPALRLWLDAQDSGLLLAPDEPLAWNAAGDGLACRAWPAGQGETGYWLWRQGEGWRLLAPPRDSLEDEPGLLCGSVAALEQDSLLIAAELMLTRLEPLRHGQCQQRIYSAIDRLGGHDARGRALLRRCGLQRLQLLLPLAAEAPARGQCRLRLTLAGARRVELHWLRDSADGRLGAYACLLDGERLPGEWQLDVRSSDDGAQLALLGFAEAPAAPGVIGLLEVAEGRLHSRALDVPLGRLLDLHDGRLWLSAIVGRVEEGHATTPLQRFTRQAPHPQRAAAFIRPQADSHLCYRALCLSVPELQRLPEWRLAGQAQAAYAEGDFILPAPGGADAAWLFGAEAEYHDSDPRLARSGGCLLTASGIGIAELTPALIWSADARYLLLTRQEPADDWHDFGTRLPQWQPYLLDLEQRRLYGPGPDLGCLPLLESFADGVLRYRVFDSDWHVPDETGTAAERPLEAMLQWPVQALEPCGSLWLPAGERGRAGQWQRLERTHLQTWR